MIAASVQLVSAARGAGGIRGIFPFFADAADGVPEPRARPPATSAQPQHHQSDILVALLADRLEPAALQHAA
jgi:hypothetical protein